MQGLTEAMVIANCCILWEEGIVKLKAQLMEAMDANMTLMSVATDLTQEKDRLAIDLAKLKMDVCTKDEKLSRMTKSYKKALDQLKDLSEQMESLKAYVMEEYKLSDARDDNNTKYFLAGFELLRKQAKEKYPDLDFDVFQPYEDDDSVMLVEKGGDVAASVDPQLDDDATTWTIFQNNIYFLWGLFWRLCSFLSPLGQGFKQYWVLY